MGLVGGGRGLIGLVWGWPSILLSDRARIALLDASDQQQQHIPLSVLQDLERRRIDAIRVAKYMDVMGSNKRGEPHPRIALAAKAYKVKEVKVRRSWTLGGEGGGG